MPARSTRRNDDLVDRFQFVLREIQAAQLRETFLDDETSAHRILDCLRLLADLLEHEVVEATLLDLVERPVDSAHAFRYPARIEIQHLVSVSRQHAHLAVVEVDDLPCVLKNGGDIARKEKHPC